MHRCQGDNTDIKTALLHYRNTPLDFQFSSPVNILMNMSLKTILPRLQKSHVSEIDVKNRDMLVLRQKRAEKYYNQTADIKNLNETPFKPDDAVVSRDNLADKIWKQAEIVRASKKKRSYDIKNAQGRVLNCNNRMLLPDKTGIKLYQQQEDTTRHSFHMLTLLTLIAHTYYVVRVGDPPMPPNSHLKPAASQNVSEPVRRSSRIKSLKRVNYIKE